MFAVAGWKTKRRSEMEGADLTKLHQCRICKLMVKTDMSPTGFYELFWKKVQSSGMWRKLVWSGTSVEMSKMETFLYWIRSGD